MTRKSTPRRRSAGLNIKTRYLTEMKCEAGHEFGMDLEKLGQFYRQLPESVRCPHPKCGILVPIKKKEES